MNFCTSVKLKNHQVCVRPHNELQMCVCVCPGPVVSAQDATEEEEAVDEDGADDVMAEDEDDEAEVEDDENTELVRELTNYH